MDKKRQVLKVVKEALKEARKDSLEDDMKKDGCAKHEIEYARENMK